MKIKFWVIAIAAVALLVASPPPASAQDCNCVEQRVGPFWEHEFDTQAIEWGFTNPHGYTAGDTCFNHGHSEWFCGGSAQSIIEASPEWDAVNALAAFAYRLDRLSTATAAEVAEFVAQFQDVAWPDGDRVMVMSCTGPIAIDLVASAAEISAAFDQ